MTRTETIEVLKLLKTAYPSCYKNMTKEDAENTVDLWSRHFENSPKEIVDEWISEEKFPPTIADIKRNIVSREKWEDLYDN